MPIRALLLVLAVAALAGGCGRRSALETPHRVNAGAIADQPDPAFVAADPEPPVPGSTPQDDRASPGATEPAEARPTAPTKRRFILDPLL